MTDLDADKLAGRRLYLCTADRADLAPFVDACIRGGVDVVQLRDKEADARTVLRRAAVARDVCRDHGVPFILNDRPDLALDCDADGVHVGQDDAPPALARRLLGPDKIVGYSTHAPDQLAAAMGEPVDYVSVGPINATPTKPGRPGVGLGYLEHAAGAASLPFYVTGGVTPDAVAGLVAAGATRFVAVRWLTESGDPQAAARSLRAAIDDALAAKSSR